MSLPNSDDIKSMDFVYEGFPFTSVTPGSVDTNSLDYVFEGLPLFATQNVSSFVRFDEVISVTDSLSANHNSDTLSIADEFLFHVTFEFNETIGITDTLLTSPNNDVPFDLTFSSLIQLQELFSLDHTNVLGVDAYYNGSYTTSINTVDDYLLPFTNITSFGNIFEPTIILNGSYLVQNAATDPGGDISQTSLYINIKNAGLTGITACDLEGYNFTLDHAGGNFTITSSKTMGALGAVIDLYGFLGTITTTGQTLSNSVAGFTQKGIFGAPKLNRFFQYLMSANTTMLPLLTDPAFYIAQTSSWQTAKSVALGIASIVGVQLQWLVFDVAVSDFRLEANMTGLDALSSMATRAGAELRWNGNNKYIVCYPDYYFGFWTPPSCSLISTDGLSNENFLDMTTGLYGINKSVLPAYNTNFNASVREIEISPNGEGRKPQVQQVAKVKQNLTEDDPPLIFDLPFDYDKVYIQILVGPTGDTSGTNQVSLQNFITTDPKEWFEFSILGFANEYVFMTSVGGAYIPQVKVDHKLMPSPNSSIDSNNFVLTIACTRKQLEPSTPLATTQQQAAQGMAQEFYRFIKVYSGTFSCVFFGSIPIPGMWAEAIIPNVRLRIPNNSGGYDTTVIGDVIVDGIIESVNFSFPGFITVSVAKYKRLNYIEVPRIDYGTR